MSIPKRAEIETSRRVSIRVAETKSANVKLGHVGDGNFHLLFLVDRTRPEKLAEAGVEAHRVYTAVMEIGVPSPEVKQHTMQPYQGCNTGSNPVGSANESIS